MSVSINRTDALIRSPSPADTPVKPGGGSSQRFDPDKAAQTAATEKPVQAQSAHSQALAEALDGDASEAMMRGALGLGKRDGLADDDLQAPVNEVQETSHARRPQATPAPEVEDENAGVRDAATRNPVQTKDQAGPVDSTRAAAESIPDVSSLTDRHERTLMLAATMSKRDLQTHLAKEHATRLENIFQGETWNVRREAPLMATAAQMPG